LDEIDDQRDLAGDEVDQLGCEKYGRLGGPEFARIASLCPIKAWEMKAAINGWPRKWGGFADCITQIREEASKPAPLPAQERKPPKTARQRAFEAGAEKLKRKLAEEEREKQHAGK